MLYMWNNDNGVVVTDFQWSNPSLFPDWGMFSLLFNVDIVNLPLKNDDGDTEGLILLFLFAPTVGAWVVVTWGRRSYLGPAEISSLCP